MNPLYELLFSFNSKADKFENTHKSCDVDLSKFVLLLLKGLLL